MTVSEYCGTANGTSSETPATSANPSLQDTLFLLAQQAAGTHDEDDQHQQVHQREREVLEIVGAEHLHEAHQHATDDRAGERAHAADDHDHEGRDHDIRHDA